jgi:hypothetical protein
MALPCKKFTCAPAQYTGPSQKIPCKIWKNPQFYPGRFQLDITPWDHTNKSCWLKNMPISIEPHELSAIVAEAKKSFDPAIHGRIDLPAMPRYPIDNWFDSSDRGPDLSEQVRVKGHLAEPAILRASIVEILIETLNPAERKPFLESSRYMNGKNPDSGEKLNDYWDPKEVGSVFIWFAYSPDTCREAAKAIENTRFIDLLQTAHERKFAAWVSGDIVFAMEDFWQLVRGDLEFRDGILSIHNLEQSFIRYMKFCGDNHKALVHEYWNI